MNKKICVTQPTLTRRDFLKTIGLTGTALAGSSVLTACGGKFSTPTPEIKKDNTITLNALYMNQAGYSEKVLQDIANRYIKQSNTPVKISYTFVKYDELHDKIVTSAAAATATFDVILLDLIWTAEFGRKGYVVPLDDRITAEVKKDIVPSIFSAFVYNNKTWAFPFLANFQCFFYNAAHLDKAGFSAPPKTIEEWYDQMVALKSKGVVKYPYIDSWNQKEGLVCDYVRLAAQYGGDLFSDDGKPTMDKGAPLQALKFMRQLIDEGLADPSATNTDEPGAMNAFVSGAVTFNCNWTFVRGNMLNPKVSKIVADARVGLLPPAKNNPQPAGSISGFQGLAVMANSKNTDVAWDFIKFATAPTIQSENLESEFPVWTSVQQSAQAKKVNPDVEFYATNLANAHHRPRVPNYQQVSAIIQEEIHACLLKQAKPEDAATSMVSRINALES